MPLNLIYAVDTSLLNKIDPTLSSSYHELEQSEALEWFSANKLKLNIDKTTKIKFSLTKSVNLTNNVKSAYFLGFHPDPKLSWTTHGEVTARKMTKNIFLTSV